MISKEEIENAKNFLYELPNKIPLKNLTDEFCKQYDTHYDSIFEYIKQLESDNYEQNSIINSYIEREQKLIETNNKYLQKLVYSLSPTTHVLGDDYNNAFKKIIEENIDLETCKIKRKLKECWGINKKF